MNNTRSSVVKVTASSAGQSFRTASRVTAASLTARHLDILQMSDIDIVTRCALATASDDLTANNRSTDAIALCVAQFNVRCGKAPR